METVKFLELRKEVLAEIKEADAKRNREMDSSSDSDDMSDPMEQVINYPNNLYMFILFYCFVFF